MEFIHQDIFSLASGVIVNVVDCQKTTNSEVTAKIWQHWSITYQKYYKHLQHWQAGKIQPVKISNNLWICNLAGKQIPQINTVEYSLAQEAFSKLTQWASEHNLQIYVPYKIGENECEWLVYAKVLYYYCPNVIVCHPRLKLNQGFKVDINNVSQLQLKDFLKREIQSLPVVTIKHTGGISGGFGFGHYSMGTGGNLGLIYIEIINIKAVLDVINDCFELIECLENIPELMESVKANKEYKQVFLRQISSLKTMKMNKRNWIAYKGVELDRVIECINETCMSISDL